MTSIWNIPLYGGDWSNTHNNSTDRVASTPDSSVVFIGSGYGQFHIVKIPPNGQVQNDDDYVQKPECAIAVYPNPMKNELCFDIKNEGIRIGNIVSIYNIKGELVQHISLSKKDSNHSTGR